MAPDLFLGPLDTIMEETVEQGQPGAHTGSEQFTLIMLVEVLLRAIGGFCQRARQQEVVLFLLSYNRCIVEIKPGMKKVECWKN